MRYGKSVGSKSRQMLGVELGQLSTKSAAQPLGNGRGCEAKRSGEGSRPGRRYQERKRVRRRSVCDGVTTTQVVCVLKRKIIRVKLRLKGSEEKSGGKVWSWLGEIWRDYVLKWGWCER